jgi:hypothetical protein
MSDALMRQVLLMSLMRHVLLMMKHVLLLSRLLLMLLASEWW